MKHKSSSVYVAGWAVAQSGSEGRTRLNTKALEKMMTTDRERDMKETHCRRVRLWDLWFIQTVSVNDCVTVPLIQCFSLCAALVLLPCLSLIDVHFLLLLCTVAFVQTRVCNHQWLLKGTAYPKMKMSLLTYNFVLFQNCMTLYLQFSGTDHFD